jgi:hypothetical protein
MNLYMMRGTAEPEKIGDVIIDLDKVLAVFCVKDDEGKFGVIVEYTQSDVAKMWFNTEDEARNELANILKIMGGDSRFSEKIIFKNPPDKKEMLEKAMKKALEQLHL